MKEVVWQDFTTQINSKNDHCLYEIGFFSQITLIESDGNTKKPPKF